MRLVFQVVQLLVKLRFFPQVYVEFCLNCTCMQPFQLVEYGQMLYFLPNNFHSYHSLFHREQAGLLTIMFSGTTTTLQLTIYNVSPISCVTLTFAARAVSHIPLQRTTHTWWHLELATIFRTPKIEGS